MGYTHYITTPKATISKRAFNKIKADVKVIEKYLNRTNGRAETSLWDGGGSKWGVEYGDNYLAFNGNLTKGDYGHETFSVDLRELEEWGGSFCKTNRKGYDLAVAMTLISVKLHSAKSVVVKSDGDLEDEEWVDAFELYNKLFPNFGGKVTIERIKDRNCLVR